MTKRPEERVSEVRWSDHKLNLMSSRLTKLEEDFERHTAADVENQRNLNEILKSQSESLRDLQTNTKDLVRSWEDWGGAVRTIGKIARAGRAVRDLAIFGLVAKFIHDIGWK